jgi:hypothetical protein
MRLVTAAVTTVAVVSTALAIAACSSGDPAAPNTAADPKTETPPASENTNGPTFHKNVEPLLQTHCQKCHLEGGLAPFPLLTYEQAKIKAPLMVLETGARRMPPWGALDTEECKPRLPWDHDERLTDIEIKTIADWVAAGAPKGDPKDAPPPMTPPPNDLPNPTLTLSPKSPFVASGANDQFRCFVFDLPPSLQQGAYISGIHVLPGNRKVVHHAVVTTDPEGKLAANDKTGTGNFECANVAMADSAADAQGRITLQVWVPGGNPIDLPPNIAMPLNARAKLVMQIHYSPGGATADPDETKIQLRIATKRPDYLLFTSAVGNFVGPIGAPAAQDGLLSGAGDKDPTKPEFRIPANERKHLEHMQITIPPPAQPPPPGTPENPLYIYGVMAHQHLAGIDVKVDLDRGTDSQCLLQDRWDFHWQRMYTYAAPVEKLPTLKVGDKLRLRCTYDNSMFNRRMATEYRARGLVPIDLSIGEETTDEMCLVIPQLLIKNPLP